MEKLLVSEALDERDFLLQKIRKDIGRLDVITVKRMKDPRTKNGLEVETFKSEGAALYQSIVDNIDRYKRINVAIVLSNANTKIKLRSSGEEMTVAEAIAHKKMINEGADLETMLCSKLVSQNDNAIRIYDQFNAALETQRKNFMDSMLQNSSVDKLTEEQLKSIDKVTESGTPEIIDAVATNDGKSLPDIIEKLTDKLNNQVKEINSAIKISNATTYIEF